MVIYDRSKSLYARPFTRWTTDHTCLSTRYAAGVEAYGTACARAHILGITFRAVLGLPDAVQKGGQFAAKSLLKVGIVLLGVRLNFLLLAEIGPVILVANLAVVILGLLAMEWFGRKLNLPLSLRLGVAVGTCICGASAIVAAVPIIGANDEEAGISVAVISLLGTFGVVLYTLFAAVLAPSETVYGTLVGATLQEVAQVIAAGYTVNTATGDLAILVKLARVALLAPALLGINLLLRRREETNVGPDAPPLLPLFLVGLLGVRRGAHLWVHTSGNCTALNALELAANRRCDGRRRAGR